MTWVTGLHFPQFPAHTAKLALYLCAVPDEECKLLTKLPKTRLHFASKNIALQSYAGALARQINRQKHTTYYRHNHAIDEGLKELHSGISV